MTTVDEPTAHTSSDRSPRTAVIAAMVVAAVTVIAGAVLLGALIGGRGPSTTTPGDASVDAGFARDMQRHHAQAVEMSALILETSRDPEIRTLARDILLTQQQQIGQMYGWLDLWDLPQTAERPAMSWMDDPNMPGHDMASMADTPMPGMASDADVARLAAATGERADRLYLQLMIPHHQGALGMAMAAAKTAQEPQVRALAQSMWTSQTAELKVLRTMLAARGGPV